MPASTMVQRKRCALFDFLKSMIVAKVEIECLKPEAFMQKKKKPKLIFCLLHRAVSAESRFLQCPQSCLFPWFSLGKSWLLVKILSTCCTVTHNHKDSFGNNQKEKDV